MYIAVFYKSLHYYLLNTSDHHATFRYTLQYFVLKTLMANALSQNRN